MSTNNNVSATPISMTTTTTASNLINFTITTIFSNHFPNVNNLSTSSLNSTSNVLYIPEKAAMMGFVGAILISLIGIIGNMLTIIALVKQAGRLNSRATTTFVIHLAITDLLFCLFVLPITSGRYLTRSWPFGPILCRLFPLFYYGTVATSLMLITMITINRFVLIAFNHKYNIIYTKTNTILLIIFCWLFSYGIISIPLFELWGRMGYHANTFSCTILRDSQGRSPKKFLFILGFFLPMTTIIICYGLIYIHIRRQTRMKNKTSKQSSKTPRRDIRLTLLTCVVFGAFLLCFLPLFIGNVFISDNRYPYFHVFSSAFAWLNSCINPFIYFAMNARYRQAFQRLFKNTKKSYLINSNTTELSDTNKSIPSSSSSSVLKTTTMSALSMEKI